MSGSDPRPATSGGDPRPATSGSDPHGAASNGDIVIRPKPAMRFRIAWGPYQKGHIFRPDGQYREALLRRQIIEPAPEHDREAPPRTAQPALPGLNGRDSRRSTKR